MTQVERERTSDVIFRSPKNASLRDHAYDELREAIISRALAPGSRIKEREVAAQIGISTTPIKEALRRLEQEGLIVTNPRRGAVVSSAAMTALEEIVEVRAAIEGVAAMLAARKMSAVEHQDLDSQLRDMERLTALGPSDELIGANARFHAMIRRGSGNSFIQTFAPNLEPFDRSVRRQALSERDEAERGLGEHGEIARANPAEGCVNRGGVDATPHSADDPLRGRQSLETVTRGVQHVRPGAARRPSSRWAAPAGRDRKLAHEDI